MSQVPPPSSLTSSYSTGTINNSRLSSQRSLPESVLKRDLLSFQQYQYQQQQQHHQGDPHLHQRHASPPSVRPKIPPPGFQYGKVFGPGDANQPDNSWEEMNSRYLFVLVFYTCATEYPVSRSGQMGWESKSRTAETYGTISLLTIFLLAAFILPFSLDSLHPKASLPSQTPNRRTPGFDI